MWSSGRFTAWMCRNDVMQSCQHGAGSQKKVSNNSWNQLQEGFGLFWVPSEVLMFAVEIAGVLWNCSVCLAYGLVVWGPNRANEFAFTCFDEVSRYEPFCNSFHIGGGIIPKMSISRPGFCGKKKIAAQQLRKRRSECISVLSSHLHHSGYHSSATSWPHSICPSGGVDTHHVPDIWEQPIPQLPSSPMNTSHTPTIHLPPPHPRRCRGHRPHGNCISLPSTLSDCWHEQIPSQWKYFASPNTDIGLHGPTSLSPLE